MPKNSNNIPIGNSSITRQVIRSTIDLGAFARAQRKQLGLKQEDIAGLGNTGTRFISELERGKPTTQLQMALDLLDLLGLEVIVQPKSGGSQ